MPAVVLPVLIADDSGVAVVVSKQSVVCKEQLYFRIMTPCLH
jgi:hypothetical protein